MSDPLSSFFHLFGTGGGLDSGGEGNSVSGESKSRITSVNTDWSPDESKKELLELLGLRGTKRIGDRGLFDLLPLFKASMRGTRPSLDLCSVDGESDSRITSVNTDWSPDESRKELLESLGL